MPRKKPNPNRRKRWAAAQLAKNFECYHAKSMGEYDDGTPVVKCNLEARGADIILDLPWKWRLEVWIETTGAGTYRIELDMEQASHYLALDSAAAEAYREIEADIPEGYVEADRGWKLTVPNPEWRACGRSFKESVAC